MTRGLGLLSSMTLPFSLLRMVRTVMFGAGRTRLTSPITVYPCARDLRFLSAGGARLNGVDLDGQSLNEAPGGKQRYPQVVPSRTRDAELGLIACPGSGALPRPPERDPPLPR